MPQRTHLSLFSGIGGLDLAAEAAGFSTVGQCEWADYPTRVLEKHWPDVPRWRDIRDLTGDDFYAKTGLRTVDVISGGFPCQPFSVAGKQKGKGDDRYLWPEMRRVIAELAPHCVVGENVPGILRIAAADVVADLERLGYRVAVFTFEAAAVGAYHRRERIAFVAYSVSGASTQPGTAASASLVCDHDSRLRAGHDRRRDVLRLTQRRGWPAEPNVGRVAHGIPNRVDRLRCLGNAVVPQQFYPIFRAVMQEMEKEE